jgi:hypothetical protein
VPGTSKFEQLQCLVQDAMAWPATGMSDKNALGLGTLGFQEPVARKMAAAAGFTRFEVVDWQVTVVIVGIL